MPEIDFDHHSEGGDTSGGETSDDDDHNGASGSGLDGAAASQEGPYAPPHLPPDTDIGSDGNPPAGAKLPAYTGIAPGTDTRGMGLELSLYTHLRAHETGRNLVCRLLREKKKTISTYKKTSRTS